MAPVRAVVFRLESEPRRSVRTSRNALLPVAGLGGMRAEKAVETPRARVLQVVLGLDPGGTERLVLELVRRLHARQPMAVCCLDDAGLWGRELQQEGIAVTTLARRSGF